MVRDKNWGETMAAERERGLEGYLREKETLLLTLKEVVQPAHTALIVVDMQNDFVHGRGKTEPAQGAPLNAIEEMTPRLARFVEICRGVGVPVFWIVTHHGRDLDLPAYKARMVRRKEGPVAMEGTIGAQLVGELSPRKGERLFIKHGYDGFTGTDLDTSLKNRGIATLIMSGTATDVCVDTTLKRGFHLGYYIMAGSDIMATESQGAQEMHLRNIERQYGLVATSREIAKIWGAPCG